MEFESGNPFTSSAEFVDQNPHLTRYIKHLTLAGDKPAAYWGATMTPAVCLETLVSILSRLPALQWLTLSDFRFSTWGNESQLQMLRSSPFVLARLDLFAFCQWTPFLDAVTDLADLLSIFSLRTLAFDGLWYRPGGILASPPPSVQSSDIPQLILWGMPRQIELVLRGGALRRLRIHRLFVRRRSNHISDFLRDHGRNITKLDLDVSWPGGSHDYGESSSLLRFGTHAEARFAARALDVPPAPSRQLAEAVGEAVSLCRALQTLVLRMDTLNAKNCEVLPGLLSALETSTLRKLVVCIDRAACVWSTQRGTDDVDGCWDWAGIEKLLSRSRYPALDYVVFVPQCLREGDTRDTLFSAAARMLPSPHSAGLLRVALHV